MNARGTIPLGYARWARVLGLVSALALDSGCREANSVSDGSSARASGEVPAWLAGEAENNVGLAFLKMLKGLGCEETTQKAYCTSVSQEQVERQGISLQELVDGLKGLRMVSFYNRACESDVGKLMTERPSRRGIPDDVPPIAQIEHLWKQGWFAAVSHVAIICLESCTSVAGCGLKSEPGEPINQGVLAAMRCQKMHNYLNVLREREHAKFQLPRLQIACKPEEARVNTRHATWFQGKNESLNEEWQRTILYFIAASPPLGR